MPTSLLHAWGDRGFRIQHVLGLSQGLLLLGHAWNTLPRRLPRQMPEQHQLTPFTVEDQQLYSEPFLMISNAEPRHPSKQVHSCHLYPLVKVGK